MFGFKKYVIYPDFEPEQERENEWNIKERKTGRRRNMKERGAGRKRRRKKENLERQVKDEEEEEQQVGWLWRRSRMKEKEEKGEFGEATKGGGGTATRKEE